MDGANVGRGKGASLNFVLDVYLDEASHAFATAVDVPHFATHTVLRHLCRHRSRRKCNRPVRTCAVWSHRQFVML